MSWCSPGRLASDHKTIADFRKDNGRGLRKVCARFVELCRGWDSTTASVAIDGSKFKAVNNRDNASRPWSNAMPVTPCWQRWPTRTDDQHVLTLASELQREMDRLSVALARRG